MARRNTPSDSWTAAERRLFARLKSPLHIQQFLNELKYDADYRARSPRRVMRERKAACFDGAMFAAAALRELGHRARLVDLRAWNDDDHVLAVFTVDGSWGAVAKSNTTVLRYREPVYRSLRELVMSYFEVYFNTVGQKTLRSYSRPLDLATLDHRGWQIDEEDLNWIGDRLDELQHLPVVSPAQIRRLAPVDPALMRAGFLGAVQAGLFQAKKRRPLA
ncbi:MAG: hypothetical protein IPH86_10095 [bacterium]|nr:hypothetical protein [bacterium]